MLLLHDGEHGAEMIAAIAHHGRGLPARVSPSNSTRRRSSASISSLRHSPMEPFIS